MRFTARLPVEDVGAGTVFGCEPVVANRTTEYGALGGPWGGNIRVRSSSHLSLEHVCQLPVLLFPVFAVESWILRFWASVGAYGIVAAFLALADSVRHCGSFHTRLAVSGVDNGRFSGDCRGSPKIR